MSRGRIGRTGIPVSGLVCMLILLLQPGHAISGSHPNKEATSKLETLKEQAEKGDPRAQFQLGQRYKIGNGVPEDGTLAFKWFSMSAEQGDAEAQNALGACYDTGIGTTRDEEKALLWYRKAAEQGHAGAGYNLGVIYQAGEGAKKDYREALKWFEMASSKGDREATNRVASLLATCPEEGVRDGRRALAIMVDLTWTDPDVPEYLDTLAAAYAETGRFEEAVYVINRLMEEHCPCLTEGEREELRRKLNSYRESKPWREE